MQRINVYALLIVMLNIAGYFYCGGLYAAPNNSLYIETEADQRVKLIETVYTHDHDEALRQIKSVISEATTNQNVPLALRAQSSLCMFTLDTEPAQALNIALEGLKTAESIDAQELIGRFHLCRGVALEFTGDLKGAEQDYQFSVETGNRLQALDLLTQALGFRGFMYSYRGEHARAVPDLLEAYQLARKLNDATLIRTTLGNIAGMYTRIGDFEKALEYFQQVLAEEIRENLPIAYMSTQFNIGRVYEEHGDFANAFIWFERSNVTSRKVNDELSIAYAELGMGMCQVKLNQAESALKHLAIADKIFTVADDKEMLARVHWGQGEALIALNKTQEGLTKLQSAKATFSNSGNDNNLQHVLDVLAPALATGRNYEQAYQALALRQKVHSRLDEKQNDNITARLRIQFDTNKKESENLDLMRINRLTEAALQDAQRAKQWQTTAMLLAIGFIVVLAFLVWRQVLLARRMQALALTDELTSLPNRRHIVAFGDSQLPLHEAVCVLAFDVDFFKRVNDTYGHSIGDEVLKRIAATSQQTLRQHDRVGRTGGEEFLVVLPTADLATAAAVAERLRVAIENIDFRDIAETLHITVSIGVAQRLATETRIMKVSQRADEALYRAKHAGRNRVEMA